MKKALTVLGATLLVSTSAYASEQYPWKGEFSLGILLNEGNTKSETVKTGFNIGQNKEKWRFYAETKSLTESKSSDENGSRKSENTAERYTLKGKVDYKFTEKNYAFLYSSYNDDRFSGFDYQATISAGYGRRLIENATQEWDLEAGPGYRNDKYEAGYNEEEAIARIATKYTHKISDTSTFIEDLNIDSGSNNTVSESITSLKTMINSSFALKVSYTIKYNETVPKESKHYDKETSVSVLYSF